MNDLGHFALGLSIHLILLIGTSTSSARFILSRKAA